jgi:hypothetical protein
MLTTKLEAVNYILRSVGQAPIDSLESELLEAEVAEAALNTASKEIQGMDWGFNREERMKFYPDVNGEIVLPANTLKVDASDTLLYYIQKGNRLYDKEKHTFVFPAGRAVELDFVFFLDWEDLPEAARRYIYTTAARQYQQDTLRSKEADQDMQEREAKALQALIAFDSESEDYNLFRDDPMAAFIGNR